MTLLEKIVADNAALRTELRRVLIEPDRDTGVRELIAVIDAQTGALSLMSEGQPVDSILMSEIAAVKSLIATLTKSV